MSTSPTSSTSTPASDPSGPSRSRSSRFGAGLRSIVKAVWFLISVVIYVLGSVLYQAGRALIMISGWGRDETDDAAPKPPAPTANL